MSKKYITPLLTLVLLFSFTGCLDIFSSDEEDDNPLLGKWIVYRYVEESYKNNVLTDSGDYLYNPAYDEYYDAWLIEFKKDEVYEYENEDGASYYTWVTEYEHNDGEIIADGETTEYEIDGDYLIFSYEGEDTWDGDTYRWVEKVYFIEYSGDLPPASWTTALRSDDYEPDNDASSANTVVVGADPQVHTIRTADQDWFTFDATVGKNYLIIVGGDMDNVLTLYGTDGSTYIDDDDDNDYDIEVSGLDYEIESVLVWSAQASGTYYLRVTGYDSSDEGYYIISVSETTMTPSRTEPVLPAGFKKKIGDQKHKLFRTK